MHKFPVSSKMRPHQLQRNACMHMKIQQWKNASALISGLLIFSEFWLINYNQSLQAQSQIASFIYQGTKPKLVRINETDLGIDAGGKRVSEVSAICIQYLRKTVPNFTFQAQDVLMVYLDIYVMAKWMRLWVFGVEIEIIWMTVMKMANNYDFYVQAILNHVLLNSTFHIQLLIIK